MMIYYRSDIYKDVSFINIDRKEDIRMCVTDPTVKLTAEEEAEVQKAIEAEKERIRKDLLEAEVRNRLLDEQRKQPGYAGY